MNSRRSVATAARSKKLRVGADHHTDEAARKVRHFLMHGIGRVKVAAPRVIRIRLQPAVDQVRDACVAGRNDPNILGCSGKLTSSSDSTSVV